jgi:hypothetical protein
MSTPSWSDADSQKAQQIWAEYQKLNDVSAYLDKAVGIDPASGNVWFGESALDIVQRLRAQGADSPLFFLRVGQSYYQRKGVRSCSRER